MTGPVATCAGSAGGAQPPRDGPSRLPVQCESAPPRKGRGTAVGAKMLAYFHKHGEKIKVEFDEYRNTYKSIGEFGAWYDSHVGSMVRDLCEPYHDDWVQVSVANKESVKEKVLEYFDIDMNYKDGVLSRTLDRDARLCYNEWKNKLHAHFKKHGGERNLNAVRNNRPLTVRSQAHWDKCCTRFISDAFKNRSMRTSGNRAKHKYSSYHGRVSLTHHSYKMGDKQNNKPASVIAVWGDKHKQKGNWANARAEQDFHALTERETQAKATQAASSSSDTASISLTPDQERAIMEEVLGRQRGYMPGIGSTVSRAPSGAFRSTSSMSSVSMEEHQRVVQELKDVKALQTQMIEQMKQMQACFATISPDMTFTQIQVPSPAPRTSDPHSSGMSPPVCDDICDLEELE